MAYLPTVASFLSSYVNRVFKDPGPHLSTMVTEGPFPGGKCLALGCLPARGMLSWLHLTCTSSRPNTRTAQLGQPRAQGPRTMPDSTSLGGEAE